MDRKNRIVSLVATVTLLGLNLIAFNYLISGWTTARVDVTAERMYSISPATKRILSTLEEDVTVIGYFSERTHPKLGPLVPQLKDLLKEYRAVSGGRVQFDVYDPGEDPAIEEEAASRYGVRSTPFRLASKYESAIVNAYFAIVIKYADQYVRYGFEDLIEVDAAPDGDIDVRLRNLEYDLTRAIKKIGLRRSAGRTSCSSASRARSSLTTIWTPESLPEMLAEVPTAVRDAAARTGRSRGRQASCFEEIDPSTDPQIEQQVRDRYGARPMSLGLLGDATFYLYALIQVGDRVEQLPLTGDSITAAGIRESIENALRRQAPGFLKTVGVVDVGPARDSAPDPDADAASAAAASRSSRRCKRLLSDEYTVARASTSSEPVEFPSDIDILLVLKPKGLSEVAVFNLDQYLMRGGRVVICSSNYDVNFSAQGLSLSPLDTGLEPWLEHHGVTVGRTLVLDDRNQPLPLPQVQNTPFGALRTWALAPYPYLVEVRDEGFLNREIAASLNAIGMYWSSPLVIDAEANPEIEVIPLLQSSDRSWTDDDLGRVGFMEYDVPAEGTEPHLLAVALSGNFRSYFIDREIPRPATGPADAAEAEEPPAPAPTVAIEQSPETRLVVLGDSEFLSDLVARALGRIDGGFFDENLRFAQNLIDWTSLDNDMLGIRARGMVSRRLERIERGREAFIEWINYGLAVSIVFVLGLTMHWRRRQATPLSDSPDAELTARPASSGETR